MSFTFKESPYNGTIPMYTYVANGAINKGDVVQRLVGFANQVAVVGSGDTGAGYTHGVAMNTAASGNGVLVGMALPGTLWLADCNAASCATEVGRQYTMVDAATIANYANVSNLTAQALRVVIEDTVEFANGAQANQYIVRFSQANARV